MIGDYTIYERSMNGVKTLSDGISFITDGTATHNNITYTDFLQSSDELTILTNDTVTTVNINCDTLTADSTTIGTINASTVDCDRLYVRNASNNIVVDFNGATNNLAFNGISNFNNTINITNKNIVQTQTGEINQSGTGTNDLKDTNINGFLSVGSNITQSGGSASFKDVTCDNLTMRSGKSITQSGTTISNTFAGTSTIKDLIILDSVVFPASVTVPGTTTTDDIVMEDDSVIIQDLTVEPSGKTNIFRNTKTLDLEIDGDLDMIKAGSTATLKNTIIQGTAEIQGDITQTTGAAVLKTISCNNITLNIDQNITQSGTGYITQSGTGSNTLKTIELTNNSNLTFNGNGIISQPLNTSQNILNNFRCAGYGIVGGRNNTTYTNTQNIQNNNGLQLQFNRDNSSQYSFLMNNRGTGGNGGFRFQRYVAGVYLDEPLTIDDSITINKDVSIPGGSISCSSATLGNISQTEINCLDSCSVNIQVKFNTLDSQIASLQSSSSGNSAALTGISYISATDTTLIDNNLTISSGKNLLIGSTNVQTNLDSNNSAISTLNTNASGITYVSATDTTIIDNNVTINKNLIVQGMNIKAEIDALETSITTGTINTTDLIVGNINSDYINNETDIITDAIYSNLFVLNNKVIVSGVGEIINATTTLSFETGINEYYVINTEFDATVYLPDITTSQFNDVTITFILLNKTISATIGINIDTLVTNLFDINGNNIVSTPMNDLGVVFLQLISRENNWYIINQYSPNVISGSFLSITGRGELEELAVSGTSFLFGAVRASESISVAKEIQYKEKLNIQNSSDIAGGINLNFPLNEYYIANTSGNKNIVLPFISSSAYNGVAISFILNVKTATMTISSAAGSLLYDVNNGLLTNIVLSVNAYLNVKIMSIAGNWYVIDYIQNPNFITATTITATDTITATESVTSNNVYCQNLETDTLQSLSGTFTGSATINEATITQATIDYTNGWFKSPANVPGYLVNGSGSFAIHPIPCSMKGIIPDNTDDYWIVNPGYRFDVYVDLNYNGAVETFINDGISPEIFSPGIANRVSSVKVYYRNRAADAWGLITLANIS